MEGFSTLIASWYPRFGTTSYTSYRRGRWVPSGMILLSWAAEAKIQTNDFKFTHTVLLIFIIIKFIQVRTTIFNLVLFVCTFGCNDLDHFLEDVRHVTKGVTIFLLNHFGHVQFKSCPTVTKRTNNFFSKLPIGILKNVELSTELLSDEQVL